MVVLAVSHHFMKKHIKIWSALCLIPMLVYIIFLIKEHYVGNAELMVYRYAAFGVVALILALWGLAIFLKRSYIAYTIITMVVSTVVLLGSIITIWAVWLMPNVANYSRLGWTESFEKTIDYLEQEYVLSDWKDIDYDKIREELIPMVEEAEKTGDEVGFAVALYELKYEINDGHIEVLGDAGIRDAAISRLAGNDYGFSMFRAKSGEGTVITKWNNTPIDEATEGVKCIDRWHSFQTSENIYIAQPIFLAGQGGEQLEVTFINDKNKEETITLAPCGELFKQENIGT